MKCLHKPRIGSKSQRIPSPDLISLPVPNQIAAISYQNKQEFEILIDNLPGVAFKGYIDGTIDFYDHKVENLTGYPKKVFESRRKKWTDLILSEDLPKVKTAFIKALKNGKLYTREYRIKNKRNKTIWLQERSTIICDHHGRVKHVIGMFFDITERKQAEKAIKEGQNFLSSIYTSIQDGITILNFDLGIVQVNPTMGQWYPHVQPLVGKRCYQAYHGQEIPCRPCPAHRTLATGEPHYEIVAQKDIHGKCSGWLEEYSFPWRNTNSGKIKGIILYVRDITARIKSEDAVEEGMRKLKKTLNATVTALAATVETRDPYTAGHQGRVAQLACAVGQELQVSRDLVEGLGVMGYLHDIGKIAIPAEILCKPGKLSEYEWRIIKGHPLIGHDILKEIEFPCQVARVVLQHHERLNGTGYPSGLLGQDILLEAKILSVADIIEAMASHRPYRPALGLEKAMEEILQNDGILYDSDVVRACLNLFTEKDFTFK
jgi:PAS domain S-box-containing protein/putative nucleotidyltransferase with HDIG domain